MYKNINDYEQLYLIRENDDEEAKDIIFSKYKPIVLSIAKKYCNHTINGEIDDFIQEGYIGLYRAICSFNEKENTLFYTFCVICIERQIRSYFRRFSTAKNKIYTSHYSLDYDFEDLSFEEVIADNKNIDPKLLIERLDYNKMITRFKHSLDFKYSLVFELRCNGFKYREISKLLDIPISSVDNYVHVCKYRLREFIKSAY